jgi:hypothetical protein
LSSARSHNAAALDFRDLGNDAPVAAVQVRRDGLTLCFDASTLLDATRNELMRRLSSFESPAHPVKSLTLKLSGPRGALHESGIGVQN